MFNKIVPAHWILLAFVLVDLVAPGYGAELGQRAREEYAGDNQCKTCHAKIYLTYRKTGHPYKLQKIDGGPPSYPNRTSPQKVMLPAMAHVDCITCHMPRVVKSAVSVTRKLAGDEVPEGNMRGHIFRIAADPEWKMFTGDNKYVRRDIDRRAYVTIDYACLSCHSDKDREWALKSAAAVHAN